MTERGEFRQELRFIQRGTAIVIDVDVRDGAHWGRFDAPMPVAPLFDPNGQLVEGRLTNTTGTVVNWAGLTRVREGQYRWVVEVPIGTAEGMLDLELRATAGTKFTQTTLHSVIKVLA